MSDFRARIKHLTEAFKADAEPLRVIVYLDGHKETVTAHKAIVAAIRDGADIDHVETVDGKRIDGLTNALVSVGRNS